MKYLLPFVAVALVAAAPAPSGQVRLQLDSMPIAELVTVLYRDVLRVPYVVAPEVSSDRRTVSIRLDAPAARVRPQVIAYLAAMGLQVTSVAGLDRIAPRGALPQGFPAAGGLPALSSYPASYGIPSGSPLDPNLAAQPLKPVEPVEVGVYRPLYRDPAYLSDVLRSVFPELRFGSRQESQKEDSRVAAGPVSDTLVYAGSAREVAAAAKLIAQIDTATAQLSIKATVYEVSTGHANQSALSVALNLIGGKVLGGLLSGAPALDTFARLRTKNVDAVVSALSTDNRFKVVTSPSVRTRSGAEAVLTSGSQVPVLGAVSYQGDNSTPVQSVEYRDSGVILKVRPTVRRSTIDIDVSQELSNFVRTDTGVNTSPTLIKRALSNQLSLSSGDVVVLGGLTEDRDTAARSGIFKGFLGSRSKETTRTEILLVLQVVELGGVEATPAAKRGRSAEAAQPAT
jgi:general secretion pathway protein D